MLIGATIGGCVPAIVALVQPADQAGAMASGGVMSFLTDGKDHIDDRGRIMENLQTDEQPRFLRFVQEQILADQEDRLHKWRDASLAMRGKAFGDLLDVVDAIGNYPPKVEMFPGFPGSRRAIWLRENKL